MGKRKSSKPMAGPKKRAALPTTFQCLFCNHEDSVTVKIDKKSQVGSLSCKICGQDYHTSVHELSAAVDVYADWVDACDAVAGEQAGHTVTAQSGLHTHRDSVGGARGGEGSGGREEGYGEDDFVVNDEAGMEDDYAGAAADDDDD